MAEIGKLVVNLEANTAEFQGDLGKVQGDLDNLAGKSEEAGGRMAGGFGEGREGLMLLEESTGVHLPRALTKLVASIGPVGEAFSAMLPILGVVAAIAVIGELIEKHLKAAEAARELGEAEQESGTKAQMALTGLSDKLLEAQIKTDELAGNHIGALNKQLELLDHAELKDLMASFDAFGKEADEIFAKIKANTSFWEVWKSGTTGAKSALDDFKASYDALLAGGNKEGAAALLQGTLDSAVKLQNAQKTYNDLIGKQVHTEEEAKALHEAVVLLHQDGIKADAQGLQIQQQVVQALQDQIKAATIIAQTKNVTAKNDKTEDLQKDAKKPESAFMKEVIREAEEADRANKEISESLMETWESLNKTDERLARERADSDKALADASAKAQAEITTYGAQLSLKAEEQEAKNKLALHHATNAEILAADIAALQAETNAQVTALQTEITNLDHTGKDYLARKVALEAEITKAQMKGEADRQALTTESSQKELMTIQAAQDKMKDAIATDIAHSIMSNKSLVASFEQTGQQMAEQLLKNLIIMELTGNREKLIQAKKAAHSAYAAMAGIPPAPVWGVAAGAAAFAGVMAFANGGTVPGSGSGDTVPAMLSPGETVVSRALTEQVASNQGGSAASGGDVHHYITYAPQISAIDSNGVEAMLKKHHTIFQRQMNATLRRHNHSA